MAPGFTHGMQQHPGGPPGHPMVAPGMAHNPSQPGTQAGTMPHQLVAHMGVSAPGGQMNSTALMGGMPQGGNPNAHAMQHIGPQQMFQQHMPAMSAYSYLVISVWLLTCPRSEQPVSSPAAAAEAAAADAAADQATAHGPAVSEYEWHACRNTNEPDARPLSIAIRRNEGKDACKFNSRKHPA